MQQVTVGTKYQIVIPKEIRVKLKGLRPGGKMQVKQLNENTIAMTTAPTDWVERISGLMTEAWKGIDPVKEIDKMRDEWEERFKKLEKDLK